MDVVDSAETFRMAVGVLDSSTKPVLKMDVPFSIGDTAVALSSAPLRVDSVEISDTLVDSLTNAVEVVISPVDPSVEIEVPFSPVTVESSVVALSNSVEPVSMPPVTVDVSFEPETPVEISIGTADSVELTVAFSDADVDAINSGNWLDEALEDTLEDLAVVGRRPKNAFDGTGDDVENWTWTWTLPVSTKTAGAHTEMSTSEIKMSAAEMPADREAILLQR